MEQTQASEAREGMMTFQKYAMNNESCMAVQLKKQPFNTQKVTKVTKDML